VAYQQGGPTLSASQAAAQPSIHHHHHHHPAGAWLPRTLHCTHLWLPEGSSVPGLSASSTYLHTASQARPHSETHFFSLALVRSSGAARTSRRRCGRRCSSRCCCLSTLRLPAHTPIPPANHPCAAHPPELAVQLYRPCVAMEHCQHEAGHPAPPPHQLKQLHQEPPQPLALQQASKGVGQQGERQGWTTVRVSSARLAASSSCSAACHRQHRSSSRLTNHWAAMPQANRRNSRQPPTCTASATWIS
jgi:hypothetical protein